MQARGYFSAHKTAMRRMGKYIDLDVTYVHTYTMTCASRVVRMREIIVWVLQHFGRKSSMEESSWESNLWMGG
jgi:hypothetical protein